VYCLNHGLPFLVEFLEPVGTSTVPQPDAELEFFTIEVGGCCDSATQDMAVELRSDDCADTGTCMFLFIGMNDLGETGWTYITAEDCDVVDPYHDSFLLWHLILVVHGVGEGPPGDDGAADVPATTSVGTACLSLILLGAGVFLRRRAHPRT
jgi:hypothetical protein